MLKGGAPTQACTASSSLDFRLCLQPCAAGRTRKGSSAGLRASASSVEHANSAPAWPVRIPLWILWWRLKRSMTSWKCYRLHAHAQAPQVEVADMMMCLWNVGAWMCARVYNASDWQLKLVSKKQFVSSTVWWCDKPDCPQKLKS